MEPLLNDLVLLQKNCRESTSEDKEANYLELRKYLQVDDVTNEYGVFTVYDTLELIKTINRKTLHNSINTAWGQIDFGTRLWFSAIQYNHFTDGYYMLLRVDSTPHLTRNSALRAAIFDFYRYLKTTPQKTKHDIKLYVELLKWLKSVEFGLEDTTEIWFCCDAVPSLASFKGRYSEAKDNYCCIEKECVCGCKGPWQMSDGDEVLDVETAFEVFNHPGRHGGHPSIEGNELPDEPDEDDEDDEDDEEGNEQPGADDEDDEEGHVEDTTPAPRQARTGCGHPSIEGNEQLRLNDGKDGFTRPEDVENNSRFQTFYKELDMLNNNKKQMAMLQKAYVRRALYLSFVVAIESAKQRSVLAPDEIFFVADDLEKVKVFSVEDIKEKEKNIDNMIFYVVYLNGDEVDESVLREAIEKNT